MGGLIYQLRSISLLFLWMATFGMEMSIMPENHQDSKISSLSMLDFGAERF